MTKLVTVFNFNFVLTESTVDIALDYRGDRLRSSQLLPGAGPLVDSKIVPENQPPYTLFGTFPQPTNM